MKTIRIDDEVWVWLRGLARPLEDTPNSVLRRVGNLDAVTNRPAAPNRRVKRPKEASTMQAPMSAAPRKPGERITGDILNRKWHLGARHALYHKDGTFYERLMRFPGVLCDPRGYVKYQTEEQFEGDSRLNIGVKVNVAGALFTHPRYERFSSSKS